MVGFLINNILNLELSVNFDRHDKKIPLSFDLKIESIFRY